MRYIGVIILFAVGAIFLLIPLMGIVLCIIDKLCGTAYSCKVMGWHNGNLSTKETHMMPGTNFDGCSFHARCSKCKKEVMQDSQGNWFSNNRNRK